VIGSGHRLRPAFVRALNMVKFHGITVPAYRRLAVPHSRQIRRRIIVRVVSRFLQGASGATSVQPVVVLMLETACGSAELTLFLEESRKNFVDVRNPE
jgi:hypothetical protein